MQHLPSDRLRLTAAAAEYGRHPDTLRRWIRQHRLSGELVGGIWYVSRQEVEHLAGSNIRTEVVQLRREAAQLQQQCVHMQQEITVARSEIEQLRQQQQRMMQRLQEAGILPPGGNATGAPRRPKKMPILRWLEKHGVPIGTSKGWDLPIEPDGTYDKAQVLSWVKQHLAQIAYRGRGMVLQRCADPLDVCRTVLQH
jgi:transposase-like protein